MSTDTDRPVDASNLVPAGLPIGKDVWTALDEDLQDLCDRWTDETCQSEVMLGQADEVDDQTWLIRRITVTEAVCKLAGQLQERLLARAKEAGMSNALIGQACGISSEAARQRTTKR